MVRLGIVGLGTIAHDYIELLCRGDVSGVSLAALCSRESAKLARLVDRCPALHGASCFTEYGQMLSSGQIDAVLICTPHRLHPSMTLQAVQAGLHVLTEKPVGTSVEEVAAVLAELNAHPGLRCGVLYNRRSSRAYQYVRNLVLNQTLGELVRVTWLITNLYRTDAYYQSSPWRGTWREEGGGLLMTQASHQLDLMQWICGMPDRVWARCSTVDRPILTENEAELFFTYPGGAKGQFIASAHECPGVNRLEICGTRGSITVQDDTDISLVRLEEDERTFAPANPAPFALVPHTRESVRFEPEPNTVQQAATIQNFAAAIEKSAPLLCPLEEGLRSLQIIHSAYVSQGNHQEVPVPVPEAMFQEFLARKYAEGQKNRELVQD